MALTDTAIRSTKAADKPFKIYDREGLFLLVNPGRIEAVALALPL